METIGKIFGSQARVKIMRLLLLNQNSCFDASDLSSKCKVKKTAIKKEMKVLGSAGFSKTKKFFKEYKKGSKTKKKKVSGWCLNTDFTYLVQFQNLLAITGSTDKSNITKRIKNTGNIKMLVLSGIFLKDNEREIDILIVGDGIKRKSLDSAMEVIQSEIGKDLNYAIFTSEEFNYRLSLHDRFIRDILDYPHERLVDKLHI